jgi:urease accessory protein
MNRLLNRLFGTAFILCFIVLATPASAHAPIMGIGGVFGGVLHALLVPEHGLSLVALGLVLGRQEPANRHSGMLIYVVALVCGLIAAALAIGETLAADILLVATGIMGLLIAAAWMPPFLGLPLAAIAGLTVALDSRPETTSMAEVVRMLIGSGVGAAIALALVAEGSVFLRGNARFIVARVAGSWIAAIAILVLSLRVVTWMTVG